jgi:hypothetical protein
MKIKIKICCHLMLNPSQDADQRRNIKKIEIFFEKINGRRYSIDLVLHLLRIGNGGQSKGCISGAFGCLRGKRWVLLRGPGPAL